MMVQYDNIMFNTDDVIAIEFYTVHSITYDDKMTIKFYCKFFFKKDIPNRNIIYTTTEQQSQPILDEYHRELKNKTVTCHDYRILPILRVKVPKIRSICQFAEEVKDIINSQQKDNYSGM